jgi:hypothetical protein
MEKETNLSHIESLAIIQAMINKAKDQFSENGHLYLLWGWVVLFCSIGHFYLLKVLNYEHSYMIWMLTWAAVIYQIFYLVKKQKKQRVRTYTDHIVGFIWLTFIVLMFLFGFLFAKLLGPQYYKYINVGFLALYGMPTFLSGITIRFKPLITGGITCWVLSILATFIDPSYQLLFLSVAVIIAWIIPGYILRTRYKKINS